jgi:DNA-binding LacI/PurR family transcriptional regulator
MIHKKPTIKDIAKVAKVSPTAVSMALNDRPRISPETGNASSIAKELNTNPRCLSLVMKRATRWA